jgi:hypothetical protein
MHLFGAWLAGLAHVALAVLPACCATPASVGSSHVWRQPYVFQAHGQGGDGGGPKRCARRGAAPPFRRTGRKRGHMRCRTRWKRRAWRVTAVKGLARTHGEPHIATSHIKDLLCIFVACCCTRNADSPLALAVAAGCTVYIPLTRTVATCVFGLVPGFRIPRCSRFNSKIAPPLPAVEYSACDARVDVPDCSCCCTPLTGRCPTPAVRRLAPLTWVGGPLNLTQP